MGSVRFTSNVNYDAGISILLLGNSQVGKSSVIRAFKGEAFLFGNSATVGVDMKSRIIRLDNREVDVNLTLWDAAGQNTFQTVVHSFYRRADCYVLVFDITDVQTFEDVDRWVKSLEDNTGPAKMFVLMGNKTDLDKPSNIPMSEIETYFCNSKIFDRMFMVSAKNGEGIEDAFYEIADMMFERGLWTQPNATRRSTLDLESQASGTYSESAAKTTKNEKAPGDCSCTIL